MRSLIAASALVVALSGSAFAQPSQGQSGAATSPTSNSATSQNNGMGTNNMGTTGAGTATTGSGMSAPGMTNSGAAMDARNPSSQGNVGPGTDNRPGSTK